MDKKIDLEERTAKISAATAYLTLAFSFYFLKVSDVKEVIDFVPIILSVFLLILNNSIRFYNPTPAKLAALITMGLIYYGVVKGVESELLMLSFTAIIICFSTASLYYFALLFRSKVKTKKH